MITDMEALQWLDGQNLRIGSIDSYGDTPTHRAAMWGNLEMMLWLKEMGTDLNAMNMDGVSPMHLAIHFGETETIKWFMQNGGDDISVKSIRYRLQK